MEDTINDFSGITMEHRHIMNLVPRISGSGNVMYTKLRKLYIVGLGVFGRTILSLAKSGGFLSKTQRDALQVLDANAAVTLNEHYDMSTLPSRIGGTRQIPMTKTSPKIMSIAASNAFVQ